MPNEPSRPSEHLAESTRTPHFVHRELVMEYDANLLHVLRGKRGDELLVTWVPDDDLVTSLSGMVDSAASCGAVAFGVELDAQETALLDVEMLRRELGHGIGVVSEPHADGSRLAFRFAAEHPSARTPYRPYLFEAANRAVFRDRPLSAGGDEVRVRRVERDGAGLSIVVDDDGLIREASFEAPTDELAGALELLCEQAVGRPLREAADHGVLRAEARLRARFERPPSPGIVIPEYADPAFAACSRLIRELAAGVAARRTMHGGDYAEPVSPHWLARDETERRSAIMELLAARANALGFAPTDIRSLEISALTRVTIDLEPRGESARRAKLLYDIERLLQAELDTTLQVFARELRDENAARKVREAQLESRGAADA